MCTTPIQQLKISTSKQSHRINIEWVNKNIYTSAQKCIGRDNSHKTKYTILLNIPLDFLDILFLSKKNALFEWFIQS